MNETTNSIAGSLTRHTLTGGGIAGLLSAQDDLLKLLSLLLTALGLAWSVWEKISRKKESGGGNALNLFLLSAFCFLFLNGCATHPTTLAVNADQDHNISGSLTTVVSTNLDLGIQGSGNPDTGDWNVGIVVVFKEQPSDVTSSYLRAAGFIPMRNGAPYEFHLLSAVDTEMEKAAIMAALAAGGELRPLEREGSAGWKHRSTLPQRASGFPAGRSLVAPFTFTVTDAQGPVTITLTRGDTTTPQNGTLTLTARGLETKAGVAPIVAKMIAQDPDAARGYATTYYLCALQGQQTGSLTHQQIAIAQDKQAVSGYLMSVTSGAPASDLVQVCFGIAAAVDEALKAAGKPGVVP